MMFAIERSEPRKATGGRVIGVIEPEPDMERIRGCELHIRIKPKNLVDILGGGRPEPDSHGKPKEARKDAKMPQ